MLINKGMGLQPTTWNKFFEPDQKKLPIQPDFKNEVAFAFLKTALSTIPILSAPHLQGPKLKVNVYFHLVNKQLSGFSFP